MALRKKVRFWLSFALLITEVQYTTQDVVTKENVEETKEEVKQRIVELGEDVYHRFMTILMDAGGRYFCYSLEMEPEHTLSIQYKVLLLRFT